MSRNAARLLIAFLALVAVGSLSWILADQYATGDVYSDYSSKRTDRMGTAALFEALAKIYGDVTRSNVPLSELTAKNSEILILGFAPSSLNAANLDAFEALAASGNRVVVALDGGGWIFRLDKVKDPLEGKWQLRLIDKRKEKDMTDPDLRVRQQLQFEPLPNSGWKAESPIAVSRQFGKGTVVLLGESRRFTNGTLRDESDISALGSAIATPSHIVFDETHLGTVEQGTIMGLARRLRMQGVIAVSLVCALLFIWQSSAPFPPERVPSPANADIKLAAASAGEALRNLLAHHIPASQLMTACVAEWRKDRGRLVPADKLARIDAIAARPAHPLTQWREIRIALDLKNKNDR